MLNRTYYHMVCCELKNYFKFQLLMNKYCIYAAPFDCQRIKYHTKSSLLEIIACSHSIVHISLSKALRAFTNKTYLNYEETKACKKCLVKKNTIKSVGSLICNRYLCH